ncbi:testin [Caerostris darwini]|uniref:Testin n=1 Tax=Caerostris darwini TaxID=1538125 RepID=A0AAV4R939_9ARAC|nr:testin [Caerostris darwini]
MPLQCPTCLILLEAGELVVVPSQGSAVAFHPACFICTTCRDPLVELVHCCEVDGKVYCARHYSETHRKRCYSCDELIFADRYAQAGADFYHKDHLRCFHCDQQLDDSKDSTMTDSCTACSATRTNSATTATSAASASLWIRDTSPTKYVQGKFWHYTCFTCEKCQEVITDFENHEGKFYCVKCYNADFAPRCGTCKQVFEGHMKIVKYEVTTTGDTTRNLTRKRQSYSESSFVASSQEVQETAICWKSEKDVLYSYGDYKWHSECFICRVCQRHLADTPFSIQENTLVCKMCTSKEDTVSAATSSRERLSTVSLPARKSSTRTRVGGTSREANQKTS